MLALSDDIVEPQQPSQSRGLASLHQRLQVVGEQLGLGLRVGPGRWRRCLRISCQGAVLGTAKARAADDFGCCCSGVYRQDPRTSHWPLMADPVPMLSLLVLYNAFAQRLGPALMAGRQPFRLRRTLVVYNAVQVLVSCYLFYQGCRLAWFRDYSWLCQPVDYSSTPRALEIAAACYVYFVAKLTELMDTVFFVMRKKNRQVSFLHLYHHTVMPIISWGCVKYLPGGHGTFIGFINCFVHILMYSYYLLAALGCSGLWWKRYITRLQLAQFCAAFLHSFQLCFRDCGFPRFTLIFTLPNSVFFYLLFRDFYDKAYCPAPTPGSAKLVEANNNADADPRRGQDPGLGQTAATSATASEAHARGRTSLKAKFD